MSAEQDVSPVTSVDKALLLLGFLAQAGPDGATLAELAGATGFTKPSAHRLLGALVFRGYAAREIEGKRYRLGPSALRLGLEFHRDENLPAMMRPTLEALSRSTSELVHLGMLSGSQVLYLDKVDPDRPLRVWSRVGNLAPSARTGLGRALLAAQDAEASDLETYVDAARAQTDLPVNAAPEVSLDRLEEVLDQARSRGWAEEVEENERGISCVAVALTRPQGADVAVSITGPAERMTDARRAELGAYLREELAAHAPTGVEVVPIATNRPTHPARPTTPDLGAHQ
ncbi:IclR family transcriptional regulator [Corynebacterium sp. AOP40-9SA-29]|uniref:IclR family transcriptional regulator n=1 Tax=Corynebacterium sp. AOP40-9SA-29 TaxID=3457677 RepID=UPI004034B5F0